MPKKTTSKTPSKNGTRLLKRVGPMTRALSESLEAMEDASERDGATRELARTYAGLLDDARDDENYTSVLADIGPKYLAVLTSLGMTPVARGKAPSGSPAPAVGAVVTKLDELRERRESRAARAANGA